MTLSKEKPMATRSNELQLETDESFQRTEWRLQRAGWIVWSLVIFAGLIGLLGTGPLSNTEVIAPDGSLSIAYDRYLHYHHPTQLILLVGETAADELRVKFDRTLLDQLQVERIEPEPLKAELADNGIIYTFLQKPSARNAKVIFHVDYEQFGAHRGTVEVVGHEPVTLKQFVYP
jgi:hypothetical protein